MNGLAKLSICLPAGAVGNVVGPLGLESIQEVPKKELKKKKKKAAAGSVAASGNAMSNPLFESVDGRVMTSTFEIGAKTKADPKVGAFP